MISRIQSRKIKLVEADPISPSNKLLKWNSGYWSQSLQKLQIYNLDYDKVLFIDSDGLILRNLDYLFSYPAGFPNAYWLNNTIFSSAIGVIEPNKTLYSELIKHNEIPDMDILNTFVENKNPLPLYVLINLGARYA